MTIRTKALAILAASTMWSVFQPGTASAQSSGIGGDANTRLLWTGTDSRISLWKCDAVLLNCTSHQYGPIDGWTPVAITTTNNNKTCVLWKYTDGRISLWTVDPNLNFVHYTQYGPYTGWTALSLSADTNGNDWIRVIWRETEGSMSIWELSSCEAFVRYHAYGPFFGFVPGTAAAAAKPAPGSAEAKAEEAMRNAPPVSAAPNGSH